MGKKIRRISLIFIGALFLSIVIQFLCNMIFVKEYIKEPELDGDGLLNEMLYKSDILEDTYFNDVELISNNLAGALEEMNIRLDCSDFTGNNLIRFYLENKHRLQVENKEEIKNSFINYKYWFSEYDGRKDSMCYWSENHQILFAVNEYLAGQEWPNEIFSDGNDGKWHKEYAAERINAWMEQRYYYGFTEYYSNNYYIENIAPMSNFIQFASDKDMVDRMKIVMDIIWYDIASQSYKYITNDGKIRYGFMSASGRNYFDNKASDDTGNSNRLRYFIDLVMDNGEEYKDFTRNFYICFKRMYESGVYEVPQVIKEIFNDSSEVQIIKSSSGLTLQELESEGLIGMNTNQIMMQTNMEAFTNPEVINNSIKFMNKYKLFNNEMLNDFKMVNVWPLTLFNLLDEVSNIANPSTNGKAIQRSNVYTYQTPYYSMSTNQAHFAGDYADQHNVNVTNLSNNLSVFTSQPARISTRGQYWVGYGRLPYSVQSTNVNITIYDVPTKKGFLEPHIVEYTHAYFPVGLFDEVNLEHMDKGYVFGRVGDTYIMLAGKSSEQATFRFKNDYASKEEIETDLSKIKTNVAKLITESGDLRYDLILEGGYNHAWVTEVSSVKEDKSFDEFIGRVLDNDYSFNEMNVQYISNGNNYEVKYNEYFKLNNQEVDMTYNRFESVYSNTERKANDIIISFNGYSLELNYKENKRKFK